MGETLEHIVYFETHLDDDALIRNNRSAARQTGIDGDLNMVAAWPARPAPCGVAVVFPRSFSANQNKLSRSDTPHLGDGWTCAYVTGGEYSYDYRSR